MAGVVGGSIRLVEAEGPVLLDHARTLFRRYAAEFAGSLAESLCFQGFEAELAGLPGQYGPPGGCLRLALDGDRAVGCVALRDLGGGTCEMKRLYVLPEDRGRGVGRRLALEVVQRADGLGYDRMVLDTLPEMAGALALYRSLGFAEAGRYWDNPIERSLYLAKALTGPGERDAGRAGEVAP